MLKVIIYCRDEVKQNETVKNIVDDRPVCIFIGDVRDHKCYPIRFQPGQETINISLTANVQESYRLIQGLPPC